MKHFNYVKKDGNVSERFVFELFPASDKMFGIDLTEFSDEDREHYVQKLEELKAAMRDYIRDVGLQSNYRFFFGSGMLDVEDI